MLKGWPITDDINFSYKYSESTGKSSPYDLTVAPVSRFVRVNHPSGLTPNPWPDLVSPESPTPTTSNPLSLLMHAFAIIQLQYPYRWLCFDGSRRPDLNSFSSNRNLLSTRFFTYVYRYYRKNEWHQLSNSYWDERLRNSRVSVCRV